MNNILVTGSSGFIGKNLCYTLRESGYKVLGVTKKTPKAKLNKLIQEANCIVHLAGCNRSKNIDNFCRVNLNFTEVLLKIVTDKNLSIPIIFTSSIQSSLNNPYGLSKKSAENALINYSKISGIKTVIYKLPNIFGKWSKPNYNSFIATFCHNILKGKPIEIHDEKAQVDLVYIDDLCESLVTEIKKCINNPKGKSFYKKITPIYRSNVGIIAKKLHSFHHNNEKPMVPKTGKGLDRALYATYLSYFDTKDFSFVLPVHHDSRGAFSEFIQTEDAGQVSFFTAFPNQTRGKHYHHSKNERFLIIAGTGLFTFKNIVTKEKFEITVSHTDNKIIQTIPGWAHSIKNTGSEVLIALLWANEVFNNEEPDTHFMDI